MTKMKVLLVSAFLLAIITESDSITVMSIDLGSEWMKIAIVKPGVPMEIVLNKETKRKTEVAVSFRNGERLFGSSAVSQGVRFPKSTYIHFIDLLAKKMDNPLVQQYKERFPYHNLIEDATTGYVHFLHDEENKIVYSPEELLAMSLNYSRSLAEEYAEQAVDSCVITVPPYFNQAERIMMLYAAKLAGLPGAQLMDDNTASALNYGVFRRNDINATSTYIMFYDMGATSTTATIVSYQVVKLNGVADPQLSVKSVGFDRTLGGFEMEIRLRKHLIKLFNEKKKTKSDVENNLRSMAKLLKEASRLKKVLSANAEHHARVESLIDDEDFSAKVSREDFENLCSDMWPRVAKPVQNALDSAGLTMDMISKVILVGGGTRVPKVQEILLEEFGLKTLGKSLNTDEAPTLGASYEAAARSNGFRVKTFHIKSSAVYPIDIEFDRVTTHINGSETTKHVRKTLFQRNNPYPQRKVITFNRFYSDFGFDVNYGDLKFLSEDHEKILGGKRISSVKLEGVGAAHEQYGKNNETESKGVKAHFRMDENGILNLEEVESQYESNTTVQESGNTTEDASSTFQKLKDGFSSFFTGNEDESKAKGDDSESSSEDVNEEKNKEPETMEQNSKGDHEKTPDGDSTETGENEELKGNQDGGSKSTLNKTTENSKNISEIPQKIKKVKISAPIEKTISRIDFIGHSAEVFDASRGKLEDLSAKDALKVAREEALNSLESYIYDKRDKLYQEEYEKALTATEQEKITNALNDASDWMFELEEDYAPELCKDKLKELRELTRPWLVRVKERKELIPLLKDMETMFNYTTHFVAAIDALPEDDQIYTDVEINVIKKSLNETINWKNKTLAEQNALQPSQENILKPDDLKLKMGELNREVQYLLNKARTAKPKKKIKETTVNSTKTDEKQNSTLMDEGAMNNEELASNETKKENPVTDEQQVEKSDEVNKKNNDEIIDQDMEKTTNKGMDDEPQLELPINDEMKTRTELSGKQTKPKRRFKNVPRKTTSEDVKKEEL